MGVEIGVNKYFMQSWPGLADGAQGAAMQLSKYADKTVQVSGVFNSVTTSIQGSMDGTTWFTMSDSLGNDLDFTAAGSGGSMKLMSENPKFIRPSNNSGGDGSTAVNIYIGGSALV